MNPKAMPRQQLLGHMDPDTREWADGVLTHSARTVVREPQGERPPGNREERELMGRSRAFLLFHVHVHKRAET